ncbi:MAG: AAA family ATPase, partial [Chloroflexota bacterium]
MARLSIQVLGTFRATLDGECVGLESNKVRALLIYLSMESSQPHSREVLAEMFWPEQPQRTAMNNLRYALADLRHNIDEKTKGFPFLMITRDTIQFNASSDFWLDALEFQTTAETQNISNLPSIPDLDSAVALYRGSFLEGFSVRNSAPFEEWMINKREEFSRRIKKVLYRLAGYYERLGKFPQALNYSNLQMNIAPWDEDVHQQVMRLLTFDGQRNAAMLQYETCKRVLASELDMAPSAQTTALYESIRNGTIYTPLHFFNPDVANSPEFDQHPAFVAREEELLSLTQRLEKALDYQGGVVFITGEAGSGKTMLSKEFLSRSLESHADLVAVYTNCNSFAGSIDPSLPFIEMLKILAGDIETQWAAGLVDRKQSQRLWSALPIVVQALVESGPSLIDRFIPSGELLARTRMLENIQTNSLERLIERKASRQFQAEPGSGLHQQTALFDEVSSVFRAISHTHPLLLILDDLQWADQDTVNLFFYLCRRLTGNRIIIIGIYRLEDAVLAMSGKPAPFFPALHELHAAAVDVSIDLSRSNSHQFVNELLDGEPNALDQVFRATLERHTAGIPLFTVELLRGMKERGDLVKDQDGRWVVHEALDWETLPPRVEAVIAEVVERLPLESQLMLSIASVEGDEFSAEIIASVLNRKTEELVSQLSGLLSKNHRIIYPSGIQRVGSAGNRLSRYRFRHHLFQRYFYSRQDIIERAHLHEAVGKILESFYNGQTVEIAVSLARHFEFANLREKAATYLLQAGNKAQHLFANAEAIAHFRRGINLIVFLPNTPERDKLELQLQMALAMPLIAKQGFSSNELVQAYARARQLVDRCGNSADMFQVLSILKGYYNLRGDPRNSQETAQALLQIAQQKDDSELLVTAASKMVTNSFYFGQWKEFRGHVDRTIQLYYSEKHRSLTYKMGGDPKGIALAFGGMGLWMLGFPDQARCFTQSAMALEREVAIPLWSWFAFYYIAFFHVYAEELKAAQHWIDKALHICTDQGMSHYRLYTECVCGWLMAKNGDRAGIPYLERGIAWLSEIG